MFFPPSREFIVKWSTKMIQILWRKAHFTDDLLFSKNVANQRFVHSVFDHVPLIVPVLPNDLSDWPKNYPSNVRGGHSVEKYSSNHGELYLQASATCRDWRQLFLVFYKSLFGKSCSFWKKWVTYFFQNLQLFANKLL